MSLTTCMAKAGDALTFADKTQVLKLAATRRSEGLAPDDAARAAVDEVLAGVQAELQAHLAGPAAAPAQQPEAAAAAPAPAPTPVLQPAPAAPRFKVGDLIVVRDRMDPRVEPMTVRVTKVSVLPPAGGRPGAVLYSYLDPRFAGVDVVPSAVDMDGEVEAAPPGAVATPRKVDTAPKPGAALAGARRDAESTVSSLATEATNAGATNLAEAIGSLRISTGQPNDRGEPPAYARMLRERFPQLLDRAKANPGDRFDDIRAGKTPSTKVLTPEEAQAAKQKRLEALAGISKVLGNKVQEEGASYNGQAAATLTPEQERELLPLLAELLDAAVMEGKTGFADAARQALDDMAGALGQAYADALTIKHLQGAYISMSSRYPEGQVDDLMTVAQFKSKDQLKETTDAADPAGDVEPDRPAGDDPVAPSVLDGPTADRPGDGQAGQATGGRGGRPGGGTRVPRTRTPAAGAQGDPGLFGDQPDAPAGSADGQRGADAGDSGSPAGGVTDEGVEEAARRAAADRLTRGKQQREAEGVAVVPADIDNIRDTLPVLLPEQQDDVLFAETRLALEDGYGVLFTNGTGTGKTFTGLGIIKRYAKQGKTNILIVVPDDPIKQGWLRSAPMLGLSVTELADTTDAGTGIVVTTYANLRDNVAVVKRQWDLVVSDEAHENGSAKDGSITDAGYAIRALTMHPEGITKRARMQHPELAAKIDALQARYDEATKKKQNALALQLAEQLRPLRMEFAGYRQEVGDLVYARQGKARPRAVFLSATPFAWEKNVTWAQGYLFDWNKGHSDNSDLSAYEAYMVENFGYRIRYSKLTEPGVGVNRGVMQRAFNTRLKREGVLSGRMLSSEFDYDRRFVEANSHIGRRIDQGMAWFWDTEISSLGELPVDPEADYDQTVRSAMHKVLNALRSKFDYHSRLRMLEAMKAEAAIPYIRAHMAAGRKIVVYHDLIKGQHLDPFGIEFDAEDSPVEAAILERWQDEFADLVSYDWDGLQSPIEAFQKAFGTQLRLLNGQMGGGDKAKQRSIDDFNNDDLGPMVLLVQSAKDKGWSGHDTTGKHQRVLINLGLPLRPTQAIQQEGRIYRVGQSSNAMFRYFNTRTNWERQAFANQMSRRADTAENLAMGEEARGLLDAYVTSFEETGEWAPGYEGEGTGGKAADRAAAGNLTEFDLAKSYYWAQLKKTAATKAQEGTDYFATPEPVGLKMVQWGDVRPGESFLEPSGGHGAIARWVPEGVKGLAIEPSPRLAPRLELAFDGKVRQERFEDLSSVNKADVIAMNPPYGTGAKTAMEHVSKAFNEHLEIGGRLVALLPEGPAADARLDKFLTGSSEQPTRVLGTVQIDRNDTRELRKGDVIFTKLSWAKKAVLRGVRAEGGYWVKVDGTTGETAVQADQIIDVDSRGPMKETVPNSEGAHVVAVIRLPEDTFARAGTKVRTRVVIIDKLAKDQAGPARVDYDLSRLESVEDLFDEIEGLEIPARTKPRPADDEDGQAVPAAAGKPAGQAKPQGAAKADAAKLGEDVARSNGLQTVEHTSQKGNQLRGVVLRHIGLAPVKVGFPDAFAFSKDGGVFVKFAALPAVLERFPLPPVAQEEAAVYAVREPDANYDVYLFGDPVPAPGTRGTAAGRAARPANVQPARVLSVRADQALPGVYRVTSQLVAVGQRTLPVAAVRSWGDAAAALASLSRYAVEHFDALVTDAAGKPLAIVGSFKGSATESPAYSAVVLAEALRIEGAAAVWAVHNHPSGLVDLSRADLHLSASFSRAFAPSRIRWMGLASVGTDGTDVRYSNTTDDPNVQQRGIVVPGKASMSVPVVERTITPGGARTDVIDGPQQAAQQAIKLMGADPRPGLVLLSSQQAVVGWVPLDEFDPSRLAGNGRFDTLINSVMEAGATRVLIANPNWHFSERTVGNIASALALADVRTLDVIDPIRGTSYAKEGVRMPMDLPVLSGIEGPVQPGGAPVAELRAAVADATLMWDTSPGMPRVSVVPTAAALPTDIQQLLHDMAAFETTRGLMMPDGRVYLVADRINNAAEGQAVLFHEVYGHFGIRAFLGQESYESQMGLLRMANPKLATEAEAWMAAYGQDQIDARVKNGATRADATRAVRALAVEEALADRAGAHEAPKNWKLVMARLQKALRAMGWDGVANMLERMTEAETHALLMSARQVLHGQAKPHFNTLSAELGGAMDRVTEPGPLLSQPQPPAPATLKPSSTLLDNAVRIPVQAVERVALGWTKGKTIGGNYNRLIEVADRSLSVFGDAYEYAKAGLVDQYGLTPEHTDRKVDMKTAIRVGARKTGQIVDKLRALDRAQSRIAYLWMTTRPDDPRAEQAMRDAATLFDQLPEEPRLVLASLKADIEHLSDEAVQLGLLSQDVRDRHTMAYLHRSYERYEATDAGAKVARARAIKVLGEQFKGRGMRHDAGMAQIAESDWWQRKTNGQAHDPSLKGKRFHRLERRATPDTETPELFSDENGQPMGRLQQVVYWPEDEAIPRQYADWRNDGVWEARFFNKAGKLGMWRDFTLAERTKLGEIQEVKYATAVTMMQMVRDVETARFLDWVARNEAVLNESQLPADAEPVEASTWLTRSYLKREWVQVPDSTIPGTAVKRYGNLGGRWVPGPVWNDIRQIAELSDQNDLSRAFQTMLRAWKVSKTALSPVTHTNNVMSNFMLADMHDIQARHIYAALQAMLTHKSSDEAKRLIEAFQDNGGDAGMFNESEIREELFRPLLEELRKEIEHESGTALITAAQVVDLLGHRQLRQAWAAAGETKVGKKAAWLPKRMMKLYGLEDELFRLAAFIKARADGVSDREAGKFARDSFLNYEITAPWINAMRRSAFPFIAFTYRAAPMLAKVFAEKPHKLVKYMLLAAALNALAYAALGDDGDEDRERSLMADEKAGRIWGFMSPKLLRMPWNDRNGSPVFLDIRRWIPAGDIVDMGQSQSMIPVPPPIAPGGPLMLLAEFMLNSSAFTGNDLVKRTDDWDERLAKSADWLWKGVAPNFPLLPGTYSFESLAATARGQVAAGPFGQEKASMPQSLLSAVGVKVGSYPVETLDFNAKRQLGSETAEIKTGLRLDAARATRSGADREEQLQQIGELAKRAQAKVDKRANELREKRRAAGLED